MTSAEKIALWLRFKLWAYLRINRHSSFYSSHSQFGEDMVLRSLTNDSKRGFYVDIGAHHPVYGSNTYHFYLKGWQGINVDALPGSMDAFNLLRPRDINVEACLSSNEGESVEYFMFDRPAFNTVSREMALRAREAGVQLLSTQVMRTTTLARLLDRYLPTAARIDLLNIDVEGLDEEIVIFHDWLRYPARLIAIESHQALWSLAEVAAVSHLVQLGYQPVGLCGQTVVLKENGAGYNRQPAVKNPV